MDSVRAVVLESPRLQFKGLAPVVREFMESRLQHGRIATVDFVPDWASAVQCLSQSRDAARFVVVLEQTSPLTDLELVRAVVDRVAASAAPFCIAEGAVPGTGVKIALDLDRLGILPEDIARRRAGTALVRWSSQARHNNQFDLNKYKRLKMFLTLRERVPDLSRLSVDDIVRKISSDEALFSALVSYGGGEIVIIEVCPHCDGELVPLPMAMSQPFCGYLPSDRPIYHECTDCGLVVASPAVADQGTSGLYDEFDYEDFKASANNPYDGSSPRCDFSDLLDRLPDRTRLLDLGGGVGRFSIWAKSRFPEWEITHSDFELKQSADLGPRGVQARSLDFLADRIGHEEYDLITAWEVIEHVPFRRLSGFLSNVWAALSPGGFFVFSTPDFDSPLCKSFDFYAMCPPFHTTVFGEKWLRGYFGAMTEWEYLRPRYCSDFLDDAIEWMRYAARTSPSFQLRSLSTVLEQVFLADTDRSLRRRLLEIGMGTEVIVTLRKVPNWQ